MDPLTGEPVVELFRATGGGRRRASSKRWRNIALALGLALAILVGATGQLLFSALNRGGTSAGGTASPTASAEGASPTLSSQGPGTASPTATAGSSATAGASATDGASATASAGTATASNVPTPAPLVSGTASSATVTFHDLMLDSAADSGGLARTFAFTTDGPGSVSAQVVGAAPLANLKLCIQVNQGAQRCATGTTPGFTGAPSSGDQAQWTVTLIATDPGSTPVIDVAFTWGTRSPAITLSHGRFQGAPNPDSLRGFTATFKTRAAGSVGVVASWPPASVDAALTLSDVTSSPGSTVGQASYQAAGSISPTYVHVVAAGRIYQIQVQNTGSDSGRPDLTTTISFP